MPDNSQKIKLAESVLAAHKQKLPSATNKDQIRRQIAAIEKKLAELRAEHDPPRA